MRIIDFHTHYYPAKIVERAIATYRDKIGLTPASDGTRAGLEASMKAAGIERSVALPLVTKVGNAPGVLHWAKAEDHGVITMLGSVHPRDPAFRETLQEAKLLGFKGIKVHPEYQSFEFTEMALEPVWELCEELGFFLITHAGADIGFPPPWHSRPQELLEFHRRHPALQLVLAHGGSWRMWDDVERYLVDSDVWFDLAFVTECLAADQVKTLIRHHGAERCLFGTDSPWCDQTQAIANLRALQLEDAEEAAIFHRNAEFLLQL